MHAAAAAGVTASPANERSWKQRDEKQVRTVLSGHKQVRVVKLDHKQVRAVKRGHKQVYANCE